jgi:hypothetical protein
MLKRHGRGDMTGEHLRATGPVIPLRTSIVVTAVPGILAAGWGIRSLSAGEPLRADGAGLAVLTGLTVLGAVTGAIVGPRILYGKQVVPPDAGDSCATGGEGADSPG